MSLISITACLRSSAVRIEVEGKGSSTAPPALIAGTSTFGPMSRAMKDKEVVEFEKVVHVPVASGAPAASASAAPSFIRRRGRKISITPASAW